MEGLLFHKLSSKKFWNILYQKKKLEPPKKRARAEFEAEQVLLPIQPAVEVPAEAPVINELKQRVEEIKKKLRKMKDFEEGARELIELMPEHLNRKNQSIFYHALTVVGNRSGKRGASDETVHRVFEEALKYVDCMTEGYRRNIQWWAQLAKERKEGTHSSPPVHSVAPERHSLARRVAPPPVPSRVVTVEEARSLLREATPPSNMNTLLGQLFLNLLGMNNRFRVNSIFDGDDSDNEDDSNDRGEKQAVFALDESVKEMFRVNTLLACQVNLKEQTTGFMLDERTVGLLRDDNSDSLLRLHLCAFREDRSLVAPSFTEISFNNISLADSFDSLVLPPPKHFAKKHF